MSNQHRFSHQPDSAEELSRELRDGFRKLAPPEQDPPNCSAMLSDVYQAYDHKETPMSVFSKLFSRRRWYLQLALGAFVVAAILGLAFFVPSLDNLDEGIGSTPAWATANGYELVYEFPAPPMSPNADGMYEIQDPIELQALNEKLREWSEARQAEGVTEDLQVIFNIKVSESAMQVVVGLPGAELKLAEELRDYLADVPGAPTPTISEMTWFYDLDKGIDQHGLVINIGDDQFTFPPGASEEKIEETIKAHFAQLGKDVGVDLSINVVPTADGSECRVKVRIGDPEKAEEN